MSTFSITVKSKELSVEVDDAEALVYLSIEAVPPTAEADEPLYSQTIAIPLEDMGVLFSILDRAMNEAQTREFRGLGPEVERAPAQAFRGLGGAIRRTT